MRVINVRIFGKMRLAVVMVQPLDLLRCHAVIYYRTHADDKVFEALKCGGVVILTTRNHRAVLLRIVRTADGNSAAAA